MSIDIFTSPGPFSTAELAEASRCSQRFVQLAVEAGTLAAKRLGRVIRIPASAARRFAIDLGVEPPPDFVGEVRDMRDVRQVRVVRDVRIAGGKGGGASS